MSQESLELVRRVFEAFNSGDPDTIASLTTDDVEIVPLRAALEGTVYSGPEAAYLFWSGATEAWSEMHIDVQAVDDLGDRAVVAGLMRGRAQDTGIEVDASLGWVFAFRDGLISHIRTCLSEADARAAVEDR